MIPNPDLAEPILRWVAETSLQVAVLCAAMLLVEAVAWRWLSARTRVWLWSLVLLRLVLPPLPAPPDSDFLTKTKLVARLTPKAATEPGAAEPKDPSIESKRATSRRPEVFPQLAPGAWTNAPTTLDAASTADETAGKTAIESSTIVPALCGGWIVGFLAWIAAAIVRERRLRVSLRSAARCADEPLLAEIASAARSIGLARRVEVIVTDAVGGPAATGIRRAVLLLPPDFAATRDEPARRCVLLHELAHLRHRDALADAVLAALRAAFWFHPFVHVAMRRLHEAREELRDHEALSAQGAPPPASYARTLLDAIERGSVDRSTPALAFLRGHEWKRRLTMIQNHGQRSRIVRIASSFALLLLASGVVLGAATSTLTPKNDPGAVALRDLDRVRVEGYAQWPQWREDLERTFDRVLPELKFENANRRDALSSLAFLASLNVVLDPDLDPMWFEEPVDLVARSVTVREALDLLLGPTQALGYECFEGGLRIAPRDAIRPETETRFYSLAPFVEGVDDVDHRHDVYSTLIDLLRAYADPSRGARFDEGVWSIGTYRDLLVLNADRAMHDSSKRFLERLLGPIDEVAKEPVVARPYEQEIDRALATRVSYDFDGQPLSDVLRLLSNAVGFSILVDESRRDEPVAMNVKDVPAREILVQLGRRLALFPVVRSGVIVFSESPESTVELYDIADLVPATGDERFEAIDSLADVIRSQIDPSSWDNHPGFSISFLGGRMIVRQTPENQLALRGMLAALEKALGDD